LLVIFSWFGSFHNNIFHCCACEFHVMPVGASHRD
jgi:hypothetical protein